ncbi:hypothetical protein PGT21_025624 [Puccinia graminis f. sp. tritici]|uniref:Uncharacterized protein n=1 Tax=Puccinia graminis f. sp. tritici TaxID=56615 RepID=A0A5B0R1Q1_PUCGR|nr:hypothetical protein PGT21_025624 [Puccinia graminis f. sp. tritici]
MPSPGQLLSMASSPRLLTSTRTPSSPGFDFQRMANRATPPPSLNGVPIPHLGTGDQKSTPTAVPIHVRILRISSSVPLQTRRPGSRDWIGTEDCALTAHLITARCGRTSLRVPIYISESVFSPDRDPNIRTAMEMLLRPSLTVIWCCKRVWEQAPVPRVLAPPRPGPAPRGLDLAGRAGVGPWHWLKSGLAEPKLWAHQITDIDYHHHHTRDPPS